MITVDKLTMDFKMDDLTFAQELYASWESFFQRSVEQVIDEQLSTLDKEDSIIYVDSLEVEVGVLPEDEFYQSFPKRFANALYEQFHGLLLQYTHSSSSGIEIKSVSGSRSDALIFFLRYGYIPSSIQADNNRPSDLLEEIVRSEESSFINKLQEEWKHTHFRYRLTLQFNDKELQDLTSIIHRPDADYIGNCVRYSSPLYTVADKNHISQNVYRSVLWIITFTFLLENVITPFSRRSYLLYLIRNLAAHYNLNYLELVTGLYNEVLVNRQDIFFMPELSQLWGELNNPAQEDQISFSGNNPANDITGKKEESLNHLYTNDNNRQETSVATDKPDVPVEKRTTSSFSEEEIIRSKTSRDHAVTIVPGKRIDEGEPSLDEGKTTADATGNKTMNTTTTDANRSYEVTSLNGKNNPQSDNFMNETNGSRIFIPNAGLVLIYPFIPRLFSMLKLTDNGTFPSLELKTRAVFILQQLLFDEWDSFPETDLVLNKLLTGIPLDEHPLPLRVVLSEEEKELCASLLEGVKQNWEKLKNSSHKALQEAFLRREGILEKTENGWQLRVEEKAYDMLLDTLPWSYKAIKYTWMKEIIHVQWR